jgi:hypothetical protein
MCGLAVLLALEAQAQPNDEFDAGPLFDGFDLTLTVGRRTEAVSPFYYYEQREATRLWAVPPLLSFTRDPDTESAEFDFVYPLLTYDRYGTEYRWQLFQLLSFSGGQNQAEIPAKRFTLFPIYFQQRSPEPDLNYTALFPIYGHLKRRLFRDEIFFVLWPIYVETRKRDVVTENYVFPFFHVRHGDGLYGWQFWPLYGREHKDVTSRTNGFGDVEIIGGHDKRFILWPFFLDRTSGIGTDNPKEEQALLPIYSFLRSPLRDSTTIGWPFFSYVDDREKKYREWQTPWPLIIFARGEGKTTSRVWPFFSQARSATHESDFYLWPIYKYNRFHSDPADRRRTRILFFLYSDIVEKNTETGAALHRVDFWPFYTYRRDFNGNTRLQALAILEPFLSNNKSIERNYSPLWSLWRAEKNQRTQASSQSLLWNLYRRETSPAKKKVSLLFGAFHYQSGAEGKLVRIFYIPIVKTQKSANAESKQ